MINEYYACYSLTSVKMSNILKTIERWAFIRCNSLTNISIPKTVTNIEYNVFGMCDSLPFKIKSDIIQRFGEEVFDSW